MAETAANDATGDIVSDLPGRPSTIRIGTLSLAGTLALSGLSLAGGGWRLGVQCLGLLVLWATPQLTDELAAQLLGYLIGAVVVVNGIGVGWTDGFAPGATVVVVVAAAIAAVRAERPWRSVGGVPIVLVWALLSLGGIYACVPESDHIRWIALAVGALILGTFISEKPIEPGVVAVLIGLLGWAVIYGGRFRDTAMIGGLGSFGLLLVEPLARVLPGHRPWLAQPTIVAVLLVVQAVGCLAIARGGGLRSDVSGALVVVVPILMSMVATCWLLGTPRPIAPSPENSRA